VIPGCDIGCPGRAGWCATAAQRAAVAQAFSNAMYQQQLLNQNQQMINNRNRPVTTNCNRFGNSVNCTSY
jgi:hypothetical protein